MREISFETGPLPPADPAASQQQAAVRDLVRQCLRGSPGSWHVTLILSGAPPNTWVVECRSLDDGIRLRMLVAPDSPEDVLALRAGLAWIRAAAHPAVGRPPRAPQAPSRSGSTLQPRATA